MSDDTDDDFPSGLDRSRRKVKKRMLSSDSSSNENSPILRPRTSKSHRQFLDDSDTDSDDSFRGLTRKRKKVARITSDSEDDSDSSGSVFLFNKMRRVANIPESESEDEIAGNSTHWETECSEDETNKNYETQNKKYSSDSDSSSGGSSDICPICLVSLKKQENGVPETCDHKFCLPCILEWSKNVNTCPVDRKEYNMVYVKDKTGEKVLRKIPIEKPEPPAEPSDPICCEICGSGEREDRLLLCDGCDLGFHLECLTPALDEVPPGSWYCNVCRSDEDNDIVMVRLGSSMELDILSLFQSVTGRRREARSIPRTGQSERVRSIPRTGQSERVISRILNRRSNVSEQPTTSTERVPPRRRVIRGRRRRRVVPTRYRTVYEVDDVTGDIISTRKPVKKKGRKRKIKKKKVPKTAKGRLAQQVGMCSNQLPNQNTPTMRIPTYYESMHTRLRNIRYQGMPTLHLFGQRDELDYFSEEDEDVVGGPDYLVRRRANHNDVAAFRRAARSKRVTLPSITVNTSPPDLLDSIMDSQSQLFSSNAMFSVDDSGKFKVNKKNAPDLKNSEGYTRKTPYNRGGNDRRPNQSYSNAPYQSGTSYYPYDSYGPSSTSENYRTLPTNSQNNGGGGYDQDMPQDYTQSTLSSYDRDVDSENSQKNEQGEDSDIDIYSDIEESVSTSKIEEDIAMKPLNLSPAAALPPLANNNSDVDNNDSENEMVIDTEKVETPTQDEEEEVKEETAVSSSEDSVAKPNAATTSEPPVDLHSTSEPVQSSFSRGREEDDDDDEDGCPNFNIYSTESINLAKNTDISLNPDENNQVVSSTPLPEPPKPPPGLTGDFMDDVYDPEFAYDPEAAYNSEKDSEEVYDPERIYDTPEDTCEPEKLADIPPPPEEIELANIPTPETEKPEADKPEEEVEKEELEEIPLPIPQEAKPSNPNALYSDSEDEEVVKISSNSFIVGDISTMTEDVSEEERSYTPCLDEKAKGMEDLGTEMISDDEKNDFDESHEHKTASEGDALEINAKESEIDMIRPEDYEEGEIVDKNKSKGDKQAEKENQEPSKTDTETTKTNKKDDKKNENKETFKKISKSNKERNYRDKERAASQGKEDKSKNKEKRKRKEIERYDVRALIADKPRRLKDKFGRDIRKSSSRSRSRSYTPKISPERRTPPQRRSSGSRERKRKKRSRSRRRSSQSKSLSRERRRSLSRSRRRRSRSHSKRKKKSKDRSKRRKRDRSTSRTYTPVRKRRKEWDDRYSRERAYSAEARWTPSLSRSPERRVSPSWTPPRTMESQAVDPRGLTVILQNDQNKKKKDKRKKNGKKTKEGDKRNKRRRKDQTPPPSKEVFASGDNILVSVSFNKENERRERDVYTKKKKEAEREEKKKRSLRRKKKNQELSSIKPVAIIDLDRSPFRELTPSPKDIIVLSDEDHVDNNVPDAQDVCDSSQQVASPENVPVYMTGPKTPPEPQVKFSIPTKQTVLRPQVNNPLRDPEEDMIVDEREQEDEMNDSYKGPNTPPEPPNSPPSSPDAYDPFEPTKSRSPSPDRMEVVTVEEEDKRSAIVDVSLEKNATAASLTPPAADIQPADSQSSLMVSRDSSKSPDQGARATQPPPITSTPLTVANVQRINILSSTILGNVSSTIPQRVAVSPVKISPVKGVVKAAPVVKATPTKPKKQGGDSNEVVSMDFESPYSPGSSDYEDLFEPPPEVVTKKTLNRTAPAAVMKESISSSKSKGGSAFDSLFDGPINKLKKVGVDKSKTKKSRGTKIIGVKLDEDHLKILDELPNSAVEMQVKDKFLKKLNRQERVVEEVKLVLKPYYNKKKIDKEEYKDIMRRAVPKICHNKSGEINPTRIKNLVEAYVRKIRHAKPKVTSSSSYNPLKSLG